METTREICQILGFRIIETMRLGCTPAKPAFHIRTKRGEIVSRDFESVEEPIRLLTLIKEGIT